MEKTVAEMTTSELRGLMEELLETKLLEMFGDPDQGLELQEAMVQRLTRQREKVAAGERGQDFDEVVRQMGLE